MMQTDEIQIRHNFSEHEVAELAREQSRSLSEVGTLEDDLNAVKKDYQSRIAANQAKISSVATRISSGFEMRTVRHIVMDHRLAGYRILVRMDNGHVSKRRNLSPEEMQMKLTDQPPETYVANVALLIDDKEWPDDACLISVFQDEYDALRTLPEVKVQPLPFKRIGEEPEEGEAKPKGKKGK